MKIHQGFGPLWILVFALQSYGSDSLLVGFLWTMASIGFVYAVYGIALLVLNWKRVLEILEFVPALFCLVGVAFRDLELGEKPSVIMVYTFGITLSIGSALWWLFQGGLWSKLICISSLIILTALFTFRVVAKKTTTYLSTYDDN